MDFTKDGAKILNVAPLLAILLMACVLRIWGVSYGLPHSYILDETFLINHALALGTGDLNPHFFEWPGSLLMYVLFGLYGLYFLVGFATGIFKSPEDFALSFLTDPTNFYLIGRIFTALVSTATIFVIYRLAERHYSRTTGLVAALFLAVSPLLAGVSHFTLTDTPLAFLCALAFIPFCRMAESGKISHYLLGGLLVGLAAAIKYNAAALLLPLLVAHLLHAVTGNGVNLKRLIFDKRIPLLGGAVAAGFIIGCPFSILDFPKFSSDIFYQFSRVHSLGNINAEFDSPIMFYLKVALGDGVGRGITLLSLLGIGYALYRHKPADIIIVSFIAGYFLYVSSWKVAVDKYLIPAVPLLVLLGASLASELYRRYAHRVSFLPLVASLCLALLVAGPLQKSIRIDNTLMQKDTRDLAKEWIEQNIPPGTKIAIDSGRFDIAKLSPPLDDIPEHLFATYISGRNTADNRFINSGQKLLQRYYEMKLKAPSKKAYSLTRIVISSEGKIDREISLEKLVENNVKYAVVSSFAYEGYDSKTYQNNHPEAAEYYVKFYRSLHDRCTLEKEFRQETDKRQGPTIRIYRIQTT